MCGMNRSRLIDSHKSLDLGAAQPQNHAMHDPVTICLTRIDPALNMARFYRLEIVADLFGGVTLVRNWGRIGGAGQERRQWFAEPDQAESARQGWITQKTRRGYGTNA